MKLGYIGMLLAGLFSLTGCRHDVAPLPVAPPRSTASVAELMNRYGELTHRSVLSAPNLPNKVCPLPPEHLAPDEEARRIKATLRGHNVACIDVGSRFVKVVPAVNVVYCGPTIAWEDSGEQRSTNGEKGSAQHPPAN